MTPMQTCPRPNGFGRNLRSKTRWFTGFCNSHQVSHFATFFIDARAEISVAESRLCFSLRSDHPTVRTPRTGRREDVALFELSFPWRGSRRGSFGAERRTHAPFHQVVGRVHAPTARGHGQARVPGVVHVFAGRSAVQVSTMILPQVHLRKPCYDFSFL